MEALAASYWLEKSEKSLSVLLRFLLSVAIVFIPLALGMLFSLLIVAKIWFIFFVKVGTSFGNYIYINSNLCETFWDLIRRSNELLAGSILRKTPLIWTLKIMKRRYQMKNLKQIEPAMGPGKRRPHIWWRCNVIYSFILMFLLLGFVVHYENIFADATLWTWDLGPSSSGRAISKDRDKNVICS